MKRINYYLAMLIFIVGFFLNDTLICRAAAAVPEESNFTNLIVFVRFAGEDEFIDKEYEVFFASTNYLKMQRHFPKVAAGNSSKLHKLPEAC